MSEGGRERQMSTGVLLPLLFLGAVVVLLPLSALADLPFERQVKNFLGVQYKAEGCAPVYHRGVFGAWRDEGHLPTPLEEGRAVRGGSDAYLVGGLIGEVVDNVGPSTSAFRRYDFKTGQFTALPDLPRRQNHVGIAAHAGAIYVVGGLGDRLEYLSEASQALWRYDIADERWTELPSMPTARGALGAAFVGDTLYAVGGRNGVDSFATVEAYDVSRERWFERAPLPGKRDHLGAASLAGGVYAVGGRYDGGNELSEFLGYDPATNRWAHLPDLPIGTSGVDLERVGNEVVVTGGEDSAQA
jgi:N-acetylneuraminic acid mutarotase